LWCSRRAGDEEQRLDILRFMAEHSSVAKYALPDDVVFVPDIPHTATGKVSKLLLRRMFKDYKPSRSKL
jgi:fatty-acyl-CoA synthase